MNMFSNDTVLRHTSSAGRSCGFSQGEQLLCLQLAAVDMSNSRYTSEMAQADHCRQLLLDTSMAIIFLVLEFVLNTPEMANAALAAVMARGSVACSPS